MILGCHNRCFSASPLRIVSAAADGGAKACNSEGMCSAFFLDISIPTIDVDGNIPQKA